jgi:hypothetical protein
LTITGGFAVDVMQAFGPLGQTGVIYMKRGEEKSTTTFHFGVAGERLMENLELGVSFFCFAIGGDFRQLHFLLGECHDEP